MPTPVDQILGSESIHSQLSVTIFRTPRDDLVAQKPLNIIKKRPKNVYERGQKVTWSVYATIYRVCAAQWR